MSNVPNAWEDEWSAAADNSTPSVSNEPKKVSAKVTKAQRRAQQAEFNRQLWAEAEGPKETNYFLESRNVVPLRSEYKAPTVLLSRKGPIVQFQSPRPPPAGVQNLSLEKPTLAPSQESSEDEEEVQARELTLLERQAQAAKERGEKQRRYEERRKELFGNFNTVTVSTSQKQGVQHRSGNSSPGSPTPPDSRSATPNRARGGRGGRRGGATADQNMPSRNQPKIGSQHRELYEPSHEARPDSVYIQHRERENGSSTADNTAGLELPRISSNKPTRAPRGPDGSGRGGFGFAKPFRPVLAETQPDTNMDQFNADNSASAALHSSS